MVAAVRQWKVLASGHRDLEEVMTIINNHLDRRGTVCVSVCV